MSALLVFEAAYAVLLGILWRVERIEHARARGKILSADSRQTPTTRSHRRTR